MKRSELASFSQVALNSGGLVAQRITRLPTEQKIPGSNPGKLVVLLLLVDVYKSSGVRYGSMYTRACNYWQNVEFLSSVQCPGCEKV